MNKIKFNQIKNLFKKNEIKIDSFDKNITFNEIAQYLKIVKKESKEKFYNLLNKLPPEILGKVLLEFPQSIEKSAICHIPAKKLSEAVEDLDSSHATHLIKDIEKLDENIEKKVYENLDENLKKDIDKLSIFDKNSAGAWTKVEVFKANINETIEEAVNRLKKLKNEKKLENILQVYIVDDKEHLKAMIPLSDVITFDFTDRFSDVIKNENYKPIFVRADEDIKNVIKKFEDLNVSVLGVVNKDGKFLGRITSDDIIHLVEDQATEQMYNLAGVKEEVEEEDEVKVVIKKRFWWLLINLFTAILASLVINLFDETIKKYVALAVLMPILASMGSNAGMQTLAVMVRKLALGEIDWENTKDAFFKEILIAMTNGVLFAVIMGAVAFIWFGDYMLGTVSAIAMFATLLISGFSGAFIPLMLRKIGQDPAVGSSIVLTTITDIVGFFLFLGLAKLMLVG